MADQVPPSMANDPAPIRDLSERLVDLVEAIAKAPTFDAVPESFRSLWKLTPALFDDIREASDTPERRDDLRRRITKAFEPLIRDGVLGPDILPRHEEASLILAVHLTSQAREAAHLVPRERVMHERLDNPANPIGKEFIAAFNPPSLGAGLFALIADRLAGHPTLVFEEAYTNKLREAARKGVADFMEVYRKGELLVEQGQEIGEEQLLLLREEHEVAKSELSFATRFRRAGSVLVLAAAMFALIGYYIYRHEPLIAGDLRRIFSICSLSVGALGLARLVAFQPWDAELFPVAIAAMILAIAYNPHFALMVTFALSLLTTVAMNAGIGHFLVLMGGTSMGVLCLHEVRTRTKLIKVGALCALGYAVLTWATGLWQDQPLSLVAVDSLWRAGWGLMAGFFLGGSLPFVESGFGIVTGISLLELGDITHPLLQELVRRAPGTHNHSVAVSTIAEAAAERIGANALLVRIGAYFHDIGKMLKPHYFVENQAGAANRHANLAPAMSTLIIIGHVKDGVDLGRQHHLPEPIIDLIEQHHGTTLVEYFFNEATKRSGVEPRHGDRPGRGVPLPRPQAAIEGGGHPDGLRRRRERQPDPLRADPRSDRRAGPRPDQQATARRPVRRVRADPPRDLRDPREPHQVASSASTTAGSSTRSNGPPDGDRTDRHAILHRRNRPLDRRRGHRQPDPPGRRGRVPRRLGPPDLAPRGGRATPRSRSRWSTTRPSGRSTADTWRTTGRPTSSASTSPSPAIRAWRASSSSPPRWPPPPRRTSGSTPDPSWPCTWSMACSTSAASTTRPSRTPPRCGSAKGRSWRPKGSSTPTPGRPGQGRRGGLGDSALPALNLGGSLAIGLPLLASQAVLVALGRALRTYSRSRLEDVCEARGRPKRAGRDRATTTRRPSGPPSPWPSSAA